jgi:hypothetical protein
MDPYLEDPALWPEFHHHLVAALCESLLPGLADHYQALIGQRHYATASPVCEDHRGDIVEIRQRNDGTLVTLLDVVSPANRTTAAGRQAYLEQRRQAKEGGASLVEIDLVLQGQPMLDYSREGLPDWDYAVTVSRSNSPERYEIYTATLQKRLPRFRLPLAVKDRDIVLDLQAAFTGAYDKGSYRERIDYRLDPPMLLRVENYGWFDNLLVLHELRQPPPPDDVVALAAYYLWEGEGRPHGRDREHWYRALGQLRQAGH